MAEYGMPEQSGEETQQTDKLEKAMNEVNAAEALSEDERNKIADKICRGIDADLVSQAPWYKANQEYLKMALQIKEAKSFPWPKSANIKYPLITIASLQFQARAYAGIVDTKNMARGKVIGYDPDGSKAERSERVGKYMTYQLMDAIENWDGDMDKLLVILPISGTGFKKVYYSNRHAEEKIDLILPQDLVVNYWAKDIKTARRVTHFYNLYHDEVKSRMKEGIYLDLDDLSEPGYMPRDHHEDKLQQRQASEGEPGDNPHKIAECHTKLDLDEDGILEPYVVVVDWETRRLLRIAPNYDMKSVKKNNKGQIIEICPKQYFVKYEFFPAPDGGFYGVGFGLLLGNLNETASTLINQLLDSGTFAITAGGFMTRNIKIKGGRVGFEPNEWKQVSFTGDDIRKALLPLPVREPNDVLFKLLSFIDQKASQIISISEISTGKLPGQNTPATTTMTSVQEGLRLFTSIYKRIYRSLKYELQLLFRCNKEHLTDDKYFSVLDSDGTFKNGKVTAEDFNDEDINIVAVADPNTASESVRLIKAQQLAELIPLGGVDPAIASQRVLEALDIPKPQELMPKPQQDPKMMQMQAKMQQDQQKHELDMKGKQQELMMSFLESQMEVKIKAAIEQLKLQMKQKEMVMEEQKMALEMRGNAVAHQQEMAMAEDRRHAGLIQSGDKIMSQREMDANKVTHQQNMNKTKEEGMKSAAKYRNQGNKQGGTGRLVEK